MLLIESILTEEKKTRAFEMPRPDGGCSVLESPEKEGAKNGATVGAN